MVENILIGVILWIIGLFFGFVIRGTFFNSSEMEIKLKKKLDETQERLSSYQTRVEAEMNKTSAILKDIQKGCEAAESQIFLVTQSFVRERSSENIESAPPRDYPINPK